MKALQILAIAATVALAGCASKPAAGPQGSPTPAPTVTGSASPTSTVSPPATVPTQTSTPAAGPPGGPVPKGFAPASVTFVSPQTGWVLGATCPTCTVSVLRTRDGGQTWAGIPGPPASLSLQGGTGVRKLRFADPGNGWAFGPDLWVTHDGGSHWARPSLPVDGQPTVSDLAASGGVAHAVVFDPANILDILTTPAGRDAWQLSPTKLPLGAGPIPEAQIVLQGGSGWVVQNDRVVVNGARLTRGTWVPWQPPCTSVGGPAVLGASTPTDLVAACTEGRFTGPAITVRVYVSTDGVAFPGQGTLVPSATDAQGVASPVPRTIVVADASRLVATFDGAATWTTVFSGSPTQSWNDLGFTNPSQGVAVRIAQGTEPASLLMTHDGGHTWAPVVFTQASQ
ncbi:MAG: hypothetical protein JWM17_834 [Actinobacteria bacterium]|nr:hypothetical protein [Actinomycetota bacterium]